MSEQISNVKIEKIYETKSHPKKDGSGNIEVTKIKIDGKYFTCFYAKKDIDEMSEGMFVDVAYTTKENEFEGKKYTNYNISNIQPHIDDGTQTNPAPTSKPTQNSTELLKGQNTINLGNKTYKVTLEELS